MMDFKGKTALITGAAVGIGRACALQFARYGANVVLLDNNQKSLTTTEQEVRAITPHVLAIACDIRNNIAVVEATKRALTLFGKIDILVNNAALWRCWQPFSDISLDEWQTFFEVNVFGTVHVTKAVLEGMQKNGYGRIINVASVAGVYGNGNMSHYSATKGAIIAFTKALAKEVTAQGITVNAVSPGTVSPAEQSDIDFHEPNVMNYAGRSGTARENAELICFLASDSAAYISGENVIIDGCRKKL